MDKRVTIEDIQAIELGGQTYSTLDTTLIASFDVDFSFDPSKDHLEYFIYDINKNLLQRSYNHPNYYISTTGITIDPAKDLEISSYTEGRYYTLYNYLTNLVNSNENAKYYINEISSDRTEIRLQSNIILPSLIIDGANDLTTQISESGYYNDFYLNFGDNQLVIANNIQLDDSDIINPSVLIKLYEPLPLDFDLKSECWVVEKLTESTAYLLNLEVLYNVEDTKVYIKGPNFNIPLVDQVNNSTEYQNYTSLNTTTTQSLDNQLKSILATSGAEINIDYSDYSNFIFFSSATTRLENFAYKLSLLEQYSITSSQTIGAIPNYYISSSTNIWDTKIAEIITNFDDYEYYLYYNSGSKAWPKTSNTPPYINYSTTSSQGIAWLTSQLTSASLYDSENSNNLTTAIPSYLLEDPDNSNYQLFVEMIGQHFDTVYTYIDGVTQKYNADNRADYGISKDIIADTLKDLGIKLYQNNFSDNNLYSTYLGLTPSGSLLPFIGNELITSFVTSSATSSLVSLDSLTTETYKRIYHNLPYLLKKKGTVEGLYGLLATFGIPSTLLQINEFGGKDKNNTNDWDSWQDRFSYAFHTTGSGYVSAPWLNLTTTGTTPKSIEFKFRKPGLPTNASESLLVVTTGSTFISSPQFAVVIEYTGSKLSSGSYSGSTVDPYYQYGSVRLLDIVNNTSASVYVPIYDGDWWSVLITETPNGVNYNHNLYVKNSIYSGNDGAKIGFQASASTFGTSGWTQQGYSGSNTGGLRLGSDVPSLFFGKQYQPPTASFQELRYYAVPLSESEFDSYVMNSLSYEGNSTFQDQTSLNTLLFRAPLGSLLNTISSSAVINSIHPSWTTQGASTASFVGSINVYATVGKFSYIPTTQSVFFNEPNVGLRNIVNNKIKLQNIVLPYSSSHTPNSNVLSPYIPIIQNSPISQSYTNNLNLVEIAFSPQNEINKDIINQLGYFNIGDFIGDPRTIKSGRYTELDKLRENYYKKYQHNYDYVDYIRLIKYFDNSLFKMLKDFVPARTSLTSGVVIKSTLLERDKYVTPQPTWEDIQYTASVKPYTSDYQTGSIEKVYGDTGGIYNKYTSSFTESFSGPAGIVSIIHDDNEEFYNGELSGSLLTVTTQSLLDNPLLAKRFSLSAADQNKLIANSNTASFTVTTTATSSLFDTFSYAFAIANQDIDGFNLWPGPVSASQEWISGYQPLRFNLNTSGLTNYDSLNITYTPSFTTYSDINLKLSGSFIFSIGGVSPVAGNPLIQPEVRLRVYKNGSPIYVIRDITSLSDMTGGTYGGKGGINFNKNINLGATSLLFESGSSYTFSVYLAASSTIPLAGDPLYVKNPNLQGNLALNQSQLNITVTNLSAQSTYYQDPGVFAQQNFPGNLTQYANYNAILNNVYSNRVSDRYFDVDYTTNIETPTNFGPIISGSALFAQVQDSNYTLARHTNPRYNGSRLEAATLNTYTAGDITYGKQPVVENRNQYFAVFDWIGGSDPQYPGGGNVHITHLIDRYGNVISLTGDNTYVDMVSNIFKKDTTATVYVKTTGSLYPLTTLEIESGGAVYQTIIAASGSRGGITVYDQNNTLLLQKYCYFLTASSTTNNILSDTNGDIIGSLKVLTSTTSGSTTFSKILPANLFIFNKNTGTYATSSIINYSDTYLPLQYGDFIRFGVEDSVPHFNYSASVDYSFEAIYGTYTITKISSSLNLSTTSSLEVVPVFNQLITGSTGVIANNTQGIHQNYRIMRRVPNESFVMVKQKPLITGVGLLIPTDFEVSTDLFTILKDSEIKSLIPKLFE